jgi:hypothetical protein
MTSKPHYTGTKSWPLLVVALLDDTLTPLPENATKNSLSARSRAIQHRPSVEGCGDTPGRVADVEYEVVLTLKRYQDELFQQEFVMVVDATRYFSGGDALRQQDFSLV